MISINTVCPINICTLTLTKGVQFSKAFKLTKLEFLMLHCVHLYLQVEDFLDFFMNSSLLEVTSHKGNKILCFDSSKDMFRRVACYINLHALAI